MKRRFFIHFLCFFIAFTFLVGSTSPVSAASCKHQYGSWKTISQATCKHTGLKSRICKKCGKKETKQIPMTSHKYGIWKTVNQATCTKQGLKVRTCKNCLVAKQMKFYAKKGHSYKNGKCVRCGKKK